MSFIAAEAGFDAVCCSDHLAPWWPPDHGPQALTIITRLLDRETVNFDGRYFRATDARLYLDDERRPPVYMSAFGPRAAEIAGRLADGVWRSPIRARRHR